MISNQEKYDFIKRHFGLDLPQGRSSFTIDCDFCGSEIPGEVTISKNDRAYGLSLSSASLDPDVQNIRVLCRECRINSEHSGRVQRWLKSISKTEQELPDCARGAVIW